MLNYSSQSTIRRIVRQMSVIFRSRRNSQTGKFEWAVEEEGTDSFYQDVARSAYADMLHDYERNKLYYQAIKNTVSSVKSTTRDVHVVDIGTGTGLLSMMAATCGASRVTAIEAFDPVACMARKIISLNGLSDKIQVISGRSTDIDTNDVSAKADVAVAEVFDTELIGENALKTFSDAQKALLKPGARVVPSRAKFFAQIVQSDTVLDWHTAKPICIPEYGVNLKVPQEIAECSGSDTVHDVQLNQLPLSDFITVAGPICVFEFDFENPICFADRKTLRVCLPAEISRGLTKADAVFTWWELDMDRTGRLILSTKPDWSDSPNKVWRDHWIQGVYFLPRSISLGSNAEFWFHACHDEYSFWFSASESSKCAPKEVPTYSKPVCSCSLHQILTRNNIARFNEIERYKTFCQTTATKIRGKRCVVLGDCSLLSLVILQLGASEVYALESDDMCRNVVRNYATTNSVNNLTVVGDTESIPRDAKFDVVLLDPFTTSTFLPWHNLHFWRFVDDLRRLRVLHENFAVIPDKTVVMTMPVEFEHLWKIRAPAGVVEGFNLKPFDEVVQAAIKKADSQVEPQPLWEYPSKALANPQAILELDLTQALPPTPVSSHVDVDLLNGTTCNGLVFWMDWFCGDTVIDTSGLKRQPGNGAAGERPLWVKTSKQAVLFLESQSKTSSSLSVSMRLDCEKTNAEVVVNLK